MKHFVDESDSCVVEQAKGALMLRYGIGSRESLAVLDRWAHEAGVAVTEMATALVHGICLGRVSAGTDVMVRWLEQRMRGDISDVRTDAGAARLAPAEGTGAGTVAAPNRSASVPRQWRYSSAVHAARVLRSR
jgi:hypothetical protein